jgi:PD-(D/E)XK endonuclease
METTMNVNEKGAIGLIEVIRDLTKKGFECFTPIHDYSRVDLIVMNGNWKPIRLQVKYRTTYRNSIGVGFNSVVNGKKIPMDLSAIDGWAIYCPEIDKVVYVHKDEIDVELGGFSFRLEHGKPTYNKSNGKERLKLYSEYGELSEWPIVRVC